MSKKQLVLIGGGHAHLVTLANLNAFVAKGYGVTVIQPSEFHYYSGMGPGMLGKTYEPDEIRFATRLVVEKQGGTFVLGKAASIDAVKQVVHLEGTTETIPYDVLSCNVGSYVPSAMEYEENPDIFAVKPIENLLRAQERIIELSAGKSIDIAIIGGGPSAVEIAGNIWRLGKNSPGHDLHIRIIAGQQIMPRLPSRVSKMACASLAKRGIHIIEDAYVDKIHAGKITLKNGDEFTADIIFSAVGVRPSSIFTLSGLPTGPDGGLRVNRQLQCTSYPNIFGGGDCIYFQKQPLDKVGVYAVRENPILFHNLMASLEGRSLKTFKPGSKYLLIYNLGDETGIFCKWSIIFGGRLAFRIKDYIDRKFMTTYKAMEK